MGPHQQNLQWSKWSLFVVMYRMCFMSLWSHSVLFTVISANHLSLPPTPGSIRLRSDLSLFSVTSSFCLSIEVLSCYREWLLPVLATRPRCFIHLYVTALICEHNGLLRNTLSKRMAKIISSFDHIYQRFICVKETSAICGWGYLSSVIYLDISLRKAGMKLKKYFQTVPNWTWKVLRWTPKIKQDMMEGKAYNLWNIPRLLRRTRGKTQKGQTTVRSSQDKIIFSVQ